MLNGSTSLLRLVLPQLCRQAFQCQPACHALTSSRYEVSLLQVSHRESLEAGQSAYQQT